jgi:hypothetical protein
MSTKIYYARKVPINRLNEFIDCIRPQVYDYAQKTIEKLIPQVTDEHIKKAQEGCSWKKVDAIRLESSIDLLKGVAKLKERTPIDIEFGLNIWLLDDYAYIIPVGEMVRRTELTYPDFSVDYSYWNNTDQPDDITDKEWDERSEVWDKVNCGTGKSSHNARRLYHSVIDLTALFGDFDFEYEMSKRLLKNIE